MDKKWLDLINNVDYAFQPIVNIFSGKTYALEALIRDYKSDDFPTIDSIFDTAYNENILYKLDMILREKAIEKFVSCSFSKEVKLFYNIDNRITSMPDYEPGKTSEIIEQYGLDNSKSRNGKNKKFDIMNVSAAVLLKENIDVKEEVVVSELSKLKKSAKMMSSHVAWTTFLK